MSFSETLNIPHSIHYPLNNTTYILPSYPAMELGAADIQEFPNQFHIAVDVRSFNWNEVKVRSIEDFVIVDGQHKERSNIDGWLIPPLRLRVYLRLRMIHIEYNPQGRRSIRSSITHLRETNKLQPG